MNSVSRFHYLDAKVSHTCKTPSGKFICADLAALRFDQLFGNGKSETRAACAARTEFVFASEAVKKERTADQYC